MSEQNRYWISYWSQSGGGWWKTGVWMGDTWQDAIHNWADSWMESYEVVSENPSADNMSGIMNVKNCVYTGGSLKWDGRVNATIETD